MNSILKELPEGSRKLIIEEYIFILYLPLKWVGLMEIWKSFTRRKYSASMKRNGSKRV